MKKIVLAVLVGLVASSAWANDFAITGGFRNNSADTNAAGATVTAQNGMQFGGLGFIAFSDALIFRTGFLYTQRFVQVGSTAVKTDVKNSYIDVPLTLMYKFSDYGGAFAGPVIALNQGKECSNSTGASCNLTVPSTILPIAIGVSFKFAPQVGGEFYFETYGGTLFEDTAGAGSKGTNLRTVGANVVVYFE